MIKQTVMSTTLDTTIVANEDEEIGQVLGLCFDLDDEMSQEETIAEIQIEENVGPKNGHYSRTHWARATTEIR